MADPEPFRANRPAPEPQPPFTPPRPGETTLPNGMHLVVIERRDLPLVAMQFLVPHGNDDATPGVGPLAMKALLRGKRDPAGKTVSERLSALSVNSSTWSALDSTGFGISGSTSELGRALRRALRRR